MTANWIFCALLIVFSAIFIYLGCKYLPRENFQFIAVIPLRKKEDGHWESVNLTYYGLFIAIALGLGVWVFLVLLTGTGASLDSGLLILTALLAVGLAAARLFSRWVEGKRHTFTTQGAFWAGGALSVPLLLLLNSFPAFFHADPLPILPALGALTIGYCLAEGWGRLACISFGCCYGPPFQELPAWLQTLFSNRCFIFQGDTKKIAYAQGWERIPVLPVQALTSTFHVLGGCLALGFYLTSHFLLAFWIAVAVSQGWRFGSEFLRRDHRGTGRFSLYQKGALLALAYSFLLGMVLPEPSTAVRIADSWLSLFQLKALLWTATFSFITFVYMGRSQVTESSVTFRVRTDRI